MVMCSKTSKRTRERCKAQAVSGKSACRHHGGRSLAGLASPSFKSGKYSKVIPVRLAQRYSEAIASPALLSLRDDLAVCEARLMDIFQRLDSGESGAAWKAVGEAFEAFTSATSSNDLPAMRQHLASLQRCIQKGTSDTAAWNEIQALWESRRKLTETETRTLLTMQQMITTEQLMTYMGVIVEVIKQAVTQYADHDCARAILGDISAEFARISSAEARLN